MLQSPLEEREYVTDSFDPDSAEEWRQVAGFPAYEVSTLGRFRNKHGRPVAVAFKAARPTVGLTDALGRPTTLSAAFRVLETFIGPKPDWPGKVIAGFRDGDTSNLSPDNLYWSTLKRELETDPTRRRPTPLSYEREEDFGFFDPRTPQPQFVGDNVGKRRLTLKDALQIQAELTAGIRAEALAARYGISVQNVKLFDRRLWKYVLDLTKGAKS